MSTRAEKTKTQIVHLLGDPSLTHAKIAKTVGCSTKTVQRVAKDIRPDLAEIDAKLEEYGRLVHERLPIRDRVELYERIARKADHNPFAAMRALERVDDLDGILTTKDRQKERREEPPSAPMFILPPGSTISTAPRRPAIDVTPGRNPRDTESDA